jgi:hypothetical protein
VLVGANMLLCLLTYWGAKKQSNEQRMRDRRTMVRENNRCAHKVMISAERLKQLASEVTKVRKELHILAEESASAEEDLRRRNQVLDNMINSAGAASVKFTDLEALSDKELAERLWDPGRRPGAFSGHA